MKTNKSAHVRVQYNFPLHDFVYLDVKWNTLVLAAEHLMPDLGVKCVSKNKNVGKCKQKHLSN